MWPFNKSKNSNKRTKPRFARSYTGAKASRLLADFLSPSSSADKEIRPALRTLRDRSRQLSRNEPFAQRALQIFRTNVVGEKGLHFQSKARNLPRQGELVGDLDAVGNDIIERQFKKWGHAGNCEVTGKFSWIDVQNMVIEGLVRDGEVLIRHIRNADNPFGYSLKF